MIPFKFKNPTKVVFGPGKLEKVGVEAASLGSRALLVTGKGHVRRSGLQDRVVALLLGAGMEAVIPFEGVDPNPRIESVRQAAGVIRAERCDVVVALGGGSVMDISKVIAATPYYEGDPWEMIYLGQGGYKPPKKALPIVTVPTLAATASEMNMGAVITNWQTHEKSFVAAPCLYPTTAVIDPVLTVSVPRNHTVYGAVDTMVHVLESYFNGADNTPLQDRIQEGVVLTVLEELPKVLESPDNVAARTNLQWASVVALNGWAQAGSNGQFPVHSIEHVVSGHFDVAHGAGLSVIMLGWAKIAYEHRVRKYVQFAHRIFGVTPQSPDDLQAAWDGIAELEAYWANIGAPVRLEELAIGPEHFSTIVSDVLRLSGANGKLPGRPALDERALLKLLALCVET